MTKLLFLLIPFFSYPVFAGSTYASVVNLGPAFMQTFCGGSMQGTTDAVFSVDPGCGVGSGDAAAHSEFDFLSVSLLLAGDSATGTSRAAYLLPGPGSFLVTVSRQASDAGVWDPVFVTFGGVSLKTAIGMPQTFTFSDMMNPVLEVSAELSEGSIYVRAMASLIPGSVVPAEDSFAAPPIGSVTSATPEPGSFALLTLPLLGLLRKAARR